MNRHLISVLAVGQLLFASQANAETPVEHTLSLAQGCFSIQSPQSGKYVKQYHSGGIPNDGENFGFRTSDLSQADKFYFKPTIQQHFMMTTENGRYLSGILPAEMSAGKGPGRFSEWRVQSIVWGSSYRYRFHNVAINRMLRHNYSTSSFYYFDLLNPNNNTSEHEFRLIPRTGCTAYPEMQVNVTGDPDVLKGNVNAPVRGVVDAHTHLASNNFMGGKFISGRPVDRYGVTAALPNSDGIHGPYGALDIIGNLIGYDNLDNRYDTRGWPNFPSFPNYQTVSHTGYYYKWIERAWLGGTRMMMSHMVENKVLCIAQSTINPAAWLSPNSCEAMDSVRLQVQKHREMVDYIDAQAGGVGKGFMQIATSPEEAREIIANGKLAVIMGVEVSELFDCGIQSDNCSTARVEAQLQELHDLGIRSIFPTHRFDNHFGGSELDASFINVGQHLSAGYLFDVEQCDDITQGVSFQPGFPLIGSIPLLGDIANGITNAPNYDPAVNACNQNSLTELGVYLVNRMIDMNMLIELDHASAKTAARIMDIVEARNYSGVISGHSHQTMGINGALHPNMTRLIQAGGFVAPYNESANDMAEVMDSYLDEVETTPYLHAVGLGTDMSGLANQPGPRDDANSIPLEYPFTNEFGLVFDKQVTGVRTMDFNVEGMAHYGMLADHIQDMRERTSNRIYNALMNSAEAYLQMWERAESNNNTAYHNPLQLKVLMVDRHSGNCLGVPGDDDDLNELVRVVQEPCDHKQQDQRWVYNAATGAISTALDSNLCLDSRQTKYHGHPLLRACASEDWTKWNYDGYFLYNKANSAYSLAVEKGDSRVWVHPHNGDWNRQWELRSEREVNQWLTYRTAQGNGCLDLHNADTTNGNYIKMEGCHDHWAQLWYYNVAYGTVHSALDTSKCLDIPNGDTSHGMGIVIWDCNGGVNQQWDFDKNVFRSRLDPNMVMDASGSHHGARIVLWGYHNRQNQRWRPVVQ